MGSRETFGFLMFSILLILNVGTAAPQGERERNEEPICTENIVTIRDNFMDTLIFKVNI